MNLQILLNSCVYEDCWWFPFNGDRGRTAERTGYELHSGVSREATYQSGLVKRHHPVKKHSSAKADTSASLCDPHRCWWWEIRHLAELSFTILYHHPAYNIHFHIWLVFSDNILFYTYFSESLCWRSGCVVLKQNVRIRNTWLLGFHGYTNIQLLLDWTSFCKGMHYHSSKKNVSIWNLNFQIVARTVHVAKILALFIGWCGSCWRHRHQHLRSMAALWAAMLTVPTGSKPLMQRLLRLGLDFT